MGMASPAIPTVRVVANVNNRTWPTRNISTSAHPDHQWKQHVQAPKQAPKNEYHTVQAGATGAGPFRNGLKTIYIPGYTGPL